VNEKFGKRYKLCSKKIIEELFKQGQKVHSFPYTAFYNWAELPDKTVSFQLVVAVSKRTFKRACDRNRIKRLTREAFRKKKHILEDALNASSKPTKQLALFLLYTHKEKLDFATVARKMEKLAEKLLLQLYNDPIFSRQINVTTEKQKKYVH